MLMTARHFLDRLGDSIARLEALPGRLHQSLEDSSFDAWIKYYRPDESSANTSISYYTKGALVALALDLTIRRDTDSKYSLDSVMRACWKHFGETGEGMPERGLESIAQAFTGLDLEEFFERYVRGTGELPLQRLLQDFGIRMHLRPAEGAEDTGGKPAAPDATPPPWLGFTLAARDGRSIVGTVHTGSPAEAGGIAPGDELIALNDVRVSCANLDHRLREYHAGDRVSLSVFRNDELLRCKVALAEPPEDTCWLELDPDRSEQAEKNQRAWLAEPVPLS